MPATNSNTVLYATRAARLVITKITSGTTSATITDVCDAAATYGSVVTDILIRSKDSTIRNLDIIICANGSQATTPPIVQVSIPANSGNNGTVALVSLAALVPQLFDVDLAGNRVIGLEAGQSIYVQNSTTTAGDIIITTKARDYTP